MKVLKGTSAWINGKLYKEGTSIPVKYEEEYKDFLVEEDKSKKSESSKSSAMPADKSKSPANKDKSTS